jgi:hypothetical protein
LKEKEKLILNIFELFKTNKNIRNVFLPFEMFTKIKTDE